MRRTDTPHPSTAGRAPLALVLLILTCAVVLTALPARAAEPFGHFGGILGGGNAGAGVLSLHGWALDDDGVASVDVYVDGQIVGRADYGGLRPDVAARHPGFAEAGTSGFTYQLDTTRFVNGLHSLAALVTSDTGERRFLPGGVISTHNLTHNLVPFGRIELPVEDAELFGNCDVNDPQRRLSVVSGYALDVGVERGDMGVGYVELLIDGAIYANSLVHCRFEPGLGGWTNCYGVRRLDIEDAFPLVKDSPHAGYRFVFDVGDLLAFGYAEGRHVLSIRSGDIAGQVADIDEIPVTFRCAQPGSNEASFGAIDLPLEGLFFGGTVVLTGYALDFEGVEHVRVYVDGEDRGLATFGQPRPELASRFPGYPDIDGPGWRFDLDTSDLTNTTHQLQVIVRDEAGDEVLIGERRFVVHN